MMHILVVNDDGPPSNKLSPYIHSFVSTLQSEGHIVSVILPHTQRSWIGKAHIVDQTLTPTYFIPGTLHVDDGVIFSRRLNSKQDEWVLVDGTPASCVQIGLYHEFKDRDPVDLVVSGPNYGRNTTATFALSSGTIGGAMEAALCGKKAIALSYAFDSREHDPVVIAAASKRAVQLIHKLYAEWPEDVDLYSINVPLRKGVEFTKILYTQMLQNKWTTGSSFEALPFESNGELDPDQEEKEIREGRPQTPDNELNADAPGLLTRRGHRQYKWAPDFTDMRNASERAGYGDGYAVLQGWISVTPLIANFWHAPNLNGEIKLNGDVEAIKETTSIDPSTNPAPKMYAVVDYPDPYVQPLIRRALSSRLGIVPIDLIDSAASLPSPETALLQYTAYESLDFDHALKHQRSSLVCAYIIRKALIRKHYLSNTISAWLVKHPESCLNSHFKPAVHFELDFAEFLDEALVDAWDLNESLDRNQGIKEESEREWWILKPGMSDGGNGIRLFSSFDELQTLFEEWEPKGDDEDEEEEKEEEGDATNESTGIMASQLRHFIAQPYIHPPLLLKAQDHRKFHIRVYVLAVGSLKVYVYREMLALFAAKPYLAPGASKIHPNADLTAHLTNTCFQDESTRENSVHRFWALEGKGDAGMSWKQEVYEQICDITGEVFEAASREQMVHFQTLPNAFEIFGADFLVDAEANAWLLELNAYPDFQQTGIDLQNLVIGGLFEDVVDVAVMPFFGVRPSGQGADRMNLVREIELGRR